MKGLGVNTNEIEIYKQKELSKQMCDRRGLVSNPLKMNFQRRNSHIW